MTTDDARTIDRLREAAKEHGEVAELLECLAECLPFIRDGGSFELRPTAEQAAYLKAVVDAAAFVQLDREVNG